MKKLLVLLLTMLLTISMVGCGSSKEEENQTVTVDGSTSMSKMIQMLAEGYENETGTAVAYNATGSSSGIQAVLEGRADIGLSSRYLKQEEKDKGLKEVVVAYDGIAIIVNPDNPVSELDVETIAKIYTGEITNWSEVGGNDGEIVLIGREAGSGTRDGFESITGTTDKCLYKQELLSTGDVITAVGSNENAIGYASLASVNETVKALVVNGVTPSEATILDGTYPISRPFVFALVEDKELSKSASNFIDYVFSDAGKALITKSGVVPTN